MSIVFVFALLLCLGIKHVHSQCMDRHPVILEPFQITVITSPDFETGSYPRNTTCSWVIRNSANMPKDMKTLVHIDLLELKCPGDKLRVYAGESSVGPKIFDEYSCFPNENTTKEIIIAGPAFVEFNSDEDDSIGIGFMMKFLPTNDSSGSGCDATESLVATDTEQFISSPGFPDDFPLNSDCSWNITANEGLSVEVVLHFIDLEKHDNCSYHRLAIHTDREIIRLCDTDDWTVRTFTGTTINLHFHTDSKNRRSGFLIGYKSVLETSTTTDVPTTTPSYYWDYTWNDLNKPYPDYLFWDTWNTWNKPVTYMPITTTPKPIPQPSYFDNLMSYLYFNWFF